MDDRFCSDVILSEMKPINIIKYGFKNHFKILDIIQMKGKLHCNSLLTIDSNIIINVAGFSADNC